MGEVLQMSTQTTFAGFGECISSVASRVGSLRSNSPAGQKAAKSGRQAVPVSRFRARDKEKAMPTNDTCGPLFIGSTPSAALQSALASRLRARLDANGSPEYELTWKEWDLPSGVPICALRASGRRTSGKGCSGLPTPKAEDSEQTGAHRGNPDTLNSASKMAGWTTPQSRDSKGVSQNFCREDKPKDDCLPDQVSGVVQSGTPAETANCAGYRLNPRFSLWLMGYPDEWASCGVRAMQSCRNSRRSSSKHISK